MPGAVAAHEVREIEEFVHVLPAQDSAQRVGPGDEEELHLGPVGLPEFAQGVDGVGGAVPVDLHPAHPELRVLRGGDDRHQVAVLGRRDLAEVLLVGPAGRYEQHLVQVVEVGDLTGRDQVPVVDRIERPAHHSDSGGTRGRRLHTP